MERTYSALQTLMLDGKGRGRAGMPTLPPPAKTPSKKMSKFQALLLHGTPKPTRSGWARQE
jgi:hypothetical protein